MSNDKLTTTIKGFVRMKASPLHDRVIVEPLEVETKTSGGIIIPDVSVEKPMIGIVRAVGPETKYLRPSDKVYHGKHAGVEYKENGKTYFVMREVDAFLTIQE